MFDPLNKQHLHRFIEAFEYSRKTLAPQAARQLEFANAYNGHNYSDTSDEPRPVKFLRMATRVYQQQLVPRSPRVLVTTPYMELKDKAAGMKIWMDDRIQEMQLEKTLRRVVLDAFLKVGIVKVGKCIYERIEYEGVTHEVGEPYVDRIDLDDFVVDLSVKDIAQAAFIGQRYRMPLEVARTAEHFDGPDIEHIQATVRSLHNETGDETLLTLTHKGNLDSAELEDMCDIWEIYFPRERLMVSFLGDEGGGITEYVLRIEKWKGPKGGPFHILGFIDVPGQVMPAGMAEDLVDLDNLANKIFVKLGDQAEEQKTIALVQSASDDGKKISALRDGQCGHVDNPALFKEVKLRGPDPANLQFFLAVKGLLEFFGGNLGALAGLGPQSETLGQDQMIQAQASKTMEEMGYRVAAFTNEILQALAFYWWHDTLQTYEAEQTVPTTTWTYNTKITAADRARSFLRLNFKIDSYSMHPQTPQAKLAMLTELWRNDIMPMAGMMQQLGSSPNVDGYLKLKSKYADNTDLQELVQFAMPSEDVPMTEAPQRMEKPPMPAQTTRTNVRVNRSGMTQQGGDQSLMQSLSHMAATQNGNGQ